MTRWPRAASLPTNSGAQRVIWAPRPMISRIGSADGSPWLSYSRVIPLALIWGTGVSFRVPRWPLREGLCDIVRGLRWRFQASSRQALDGAVGAQPGCGFCAHAAGEHVAGDALVMGDEAGDGLTTLLRQSVRRDAHEAGLLLAAPVEDDLERGGGQEQNGVEA